MRHVGQYPFYSNTCLAGSFLLLRLVPTLIILPKRGKLIPEYIADGQPTLFKKYEVSGSESPPGSIVDAKVA